MEIWVLITIAAAFFQNVRSAMQKHLKGRMGTTGATFVRFGFGMPFALAYMAILAFVLARPLPVPNSAFFLWAVVGGVAQIAATFLLVYLFSFRNFAVGTAYSRTEPAQAALFGLVFLGERASAGTLVAIAVSVVGVMVISVARSVVSVRSLFTSVLTRTAGIGLMSGTFFGISAVAYRSASLQPSAAPSPQVPHCFNDAHRHSLVFSIVQTGAATFLRQRHGFCCKLHRRHDTNTSPLPNTARTGSAIPVASWVLRRNRVS